MAVPVKTMLLGLVSNSARLIELDTDPTPAPSDPAKSYALNFYDYADLSGIQARVYFKDIDPYLQIWLVQYQGFVPGQPIMLPQQNDEPIKIDGTLISSLTSLPAMVMFADDTTPDANISVLRCCPHPPAAGLIGSYAHDTHSDCYAASDASDDWYEIMPG